MTIFKNTSINSLAAFILLIGSSLSVHGCEIKNNGIKKMNDFSFRFEEHKNAKDAEKELIKLFPIGSDVKILINKMESINAKCLSDEMSTSCGYIKMLSVATGDSWSVNVFTKESKITRMYVQKSPTSL
jgi:hypothetical protein